MECCANATGTGGLALGATVLRTYWNGVLQESRAVNAAPQANLLRSGTEATPVAFVTTKGLDAVEIETANAANLNLKTNIYNAYGVIGASWVPLNGRCSRFANPNATRYSSTAYSGSSLVQACIDSNVGNSGRAVDTDLINFATFGNAASLSCPHAACTIGRHAAPAGYYAGFEVVNYGPLPAY